MRLPQLAIIILLLLVLVSTAASASVSAELNRDFDNGGSITEVSPLYHNLSPTTIEQDTALTDIAQTPTESPTPSESPTESPTPTVSPTPTESPTPTVSPTESPILPTTANPGDVLINEVQYDPPSPCEDTDCEWLELYNPTNGAIALVGWRIWDNKYSDPIPVLTIPAGGFVIVAASSEFYNNFNNFPNCSCEVVFFCSAIGNGLHNDGDRLILKDSAGTVIDEISYGNDKSVNDPPLPDVLEGHSLERSPAGCDFIDNPNPSPCRELLPAPPTASPTPSTTPSATPTTSPTTPTTSNTTASKSDILINEVQYNPPQPGSDATSEWLELFNPTGKTISLVGWRIRDNHTSDVIPLLNLSSGGFVLVAASQDFYTNFPGCDCTVLFIEDGRVGNGLGNDGDHLILEDSAGTIIDAISYGNDNSSASSPFPKVAENHSMERSPAGGDFVDNPNPNPCYGLSPSTPTVTPTSSLTTTPTTSPTATPTISPTTPHSTATPTSPVSNKATAHRSESSASPSSLPTAIIASEAVALFGVAILIRNKIGKKPR